MDKSTFILTQISAELLAYKTLELAMSDKKKMVRPSYKSLVGKYGRMYDELYKLLPEEGE